MNSKAQAGFSPAVRSSFKVVLVAICAVAVASERTVWVWTASAATGAVVPATYFEPAPSSVQKGSGRPASVTRGM